MNFLNLSSRIFGLDIGDLSLKIVFFKRKGKVVQLKTYGEKSVPADCFLKGEIKQEKELARLIRKFVAEKNISTPYVISVLPETKTFIKIIEISQTNKENILEKIKKEIELYIPLKLEEVYFDWQKISKKREKIKILVGLSPKNIIESYFRTLKMAGLKPVALEIESMAIIRSIIKKEDLFKPRIVLDLGAIRSSFIVIDEGIIQLTISLPFSGQGLSQKIASELKINFEEAEKIKQNHQEIEKNHYLKEVIFSFLNNLAQTLTGHIGFYERNSQNKIEEIILCGGGANLFQVNNFLEEKLKIKVKRGNPWANLAIKKSPLPEDVSLIYTTAIGLALRGIEEKI